MKSKKIFPGSKKADDLAVRKNFSTCCDSTDAFHEKRLKEGNFLAMTISCLFVSGMMAVSAPSYAVEDHLAIGGGGGGAGGHYNSGTPANPGGNGGNKAGDGGSTAQSGGAGGGGSFIGNVTLDPDSQAGSNSSGSTGGAGGTSFYRPGTGTGTDGQAGGNSSGTMGGAGGMGGTAVLDSAGDLTVDHNLLYFGGTGGTGGDGRASEGTGGAGGQGGHVSTTVGNNLNAEYVLLSTGSGAAGGKGGSTGDSGTGGKGGDGGNGTINVGNDLNTSGAVAIASGGGSNGGDAFSGSGGDSGNAGTSTLNVGHDINSLTFRAEGGMGGERGYGNGEGIGGAGGKGGDIFVTVGNNVNATQEFVLTGGQGYGDTRDEPTDPANTTGRNKGGDGGSVTFSAKNVTTGTFAVTGNGGGFGSNKDTVGDSANGIGGKGGSVNASIAESVNADVFYVLSHEGGAAGDASGITNADGRSGHGGQSGDATVTIGKDLNVTTTTALAIVTAGRGGDANSTGTNVTGGDGGNSGNVNVQINGAMNVKDLAGYVLAGGDGGHGGSVIIPGDTPIQTSGTGGNGGNSGNVNLTVAKSLNMENLTMNVTKGATGGNGNLTSGTPGIGGNGGNSGSFNINVGENLTANAFNMVSGEGGDAGNNRGGNGGNGATLDVSVGQNMTADALVMNAGNGGKAGASDGITRTSLSFTENGGTGGHSTLNVAQTLQLNTLTAASGIKGMDGTGSLHAGTGGAGGNVSLGANTAILNQGTITKNDGAMKVYFNNLDMTSNDTTLALNKTTAYDSGADTGVQLGTLIFGGGRNMTTSGDGAFAINGIRVMGKGASYSGTALDASGKNLYFYLPAGMARDEVMLHSDSAVNTEGSHVDIAAAGPIAHLSNGEKVILIDNTTGTIADNGKKTSIFYQGATQYDLVVRSEPSLSPLTREEQDIAGQLVLIREGTNTYGQAYAEGQIAGLAAVMQSGDLVARFGDKLSIIEKEGPEVFFSMQGTSEKIKTGSHIKSNGVEAMGGVATHQKTTVGTIHAGVFIEAGYGNYDAYNSFPTANVKGDGNTKYFGAGVIARHDFDNQFYVEGSLRGGKVKTDYSTNDMGAGANFDSSVWYYGAHGGVGYKIPVRDKSNVDVYGKVLWTQMNSDSLTTGAGENVHFDNADSLRSRLGVRYNHQLEEKVKGFIGVAWDYEFKGKLSSTLNGVSMGEPDMKGSTGLLEMGVSWQAQKAWTFDANLRGMAGKHEGVTGMVTAKYAF